MGIQVFKFGGTSVTDATAIRQVVRVVQNERLDDNHLIVVLSAMGGITDLLLDGMNKAIAQEGTTEIIDSFRTRHIEAINELFESNRPKDLDQFVEESASELVQLYQSVATIKESTVKTTDRIVSRGERLLAKIAWSFLQAHNNDQNLPVNHVDATEVIKADLRQGQIVPDMSATKLACEKKIAFKNPGVTFVPGFIAANKAGDLVTLGRGGSDLSAAILASIFGADSLTLYKEVDGMMTADPRYVPEARVVPELHYREASELAYYGAKILHSRTISPLISQNIPIFIRNTFKPHLPGTKIGGDVAPGAYPVKALTAIQSQVLVAVEGKGMMGVPGIAGRTFQSLAHNEISVSVISQSSSEASICFVVPEVDANRALESLRNEFALEIELEIIDDIAIRSEQAVLAVVGLGMKGTPGIAARTFAALRQGQVNIEAIAQGSSELNISIVVDKSHVISALRALHREFRLEKLSALPSREPGEVHVAIHGLGQIGRTLMSQVEQQSNYFSEKMGIDFKSVYFSDRSGVVASLEGFGKVEIQDLCAKKASKLPLLETADTRSVRERLDSSIIGQPFNRPIFVDLTAEETSDLILHAMNDGWNVVVANKKPMAIDQNEFDQMMAIAKDKNLQFRYEATVGAGLPILDTIAKLSEAGDEVRSILGCLSGTLGFLMTEIERGTKFSEAVSKAYTQGYTEPDPREDLSGMDVARKALILARTLGIKINMSDLEVEALFPEEASHDDPKQFIANLKDVDAAWSERIAAASSRGQVLRYVATVSPEVVKVGIEEVPADSPLGRLSGTDNQVTIRTRMYDENPLIVTGPGAGAAVTAAGVLNDILAIASQFDRN